MAVAFADFILAIHFVSQGPRLNLAWPCAEAHGASEFFHPAQLAQLVDHAMRSRRIELTGIRVRQSAHVACIFNTSRLHAQADSEVRNMFLARELNRPQ